MGKGTVNKVIILGRLGQDPEIRYTQNGSPIANVSIATNDGYKDNTSGQYIDVTEWHKVVVFGKQAEVVQQYCKKGSQIYVEGRIRTNKWQDKNGQDKYTTEILANSIQMIGGNSQSNGHPPIDSYEQNQIPRPSDKPVTNEYEKAKGGS
ncbi:single-stranded DNA-binding protein, partial [Fangia hongkongensis]